MRVYIFIYILIYIYIYIHKHMYYVYNIYSRNENYVCLQKDAHQFTDHFASSEMSVRVEFER